MDSFKEFQGKSLDEAISEACGYFDAPREKLEIEIVQDSKSGIFGLVGARKAKVRARRVQLRTAVEDILGRKSGLTLQAEGEAEAAAEKKPVEKRHDDDRDKGKHAERAAERHDKREKCDKRDGDDREGKPEKQERQDRSGARPDKGDRAPERHADRHADKSADKADRGDKARKDRDHKDRDSRHDQDDARLAEGAAGLVTQEAAEAVPAERQEKGDKPERAERHERADRPERAERDRTDRADGGDRSDRRERQDRRTRPAPRPGARRGERPHERQDERQGERRNDGRTRSGAPSRPRQDDAAFTGDAFSEEVLHEDGDDLQRIPFEQLDQDKLRSLSLEVVGKLVAPIVGELPLTVELQDGRVNVRMDCGDDSGLLIGREGQTLASLQYLASRMVSRGMSAAVRVQLDAGEYRLRQDEKLREMALSLAEKVRATGKSHSTRPLSSYHRRIVHLVLQDSADVQTRSSGDGPLKRVVVQRKR